MGFFFEKPEDCSELLLSLLENDPEAVYLSGHDGALLYANKAFTHVTGYESEDLIGMNIFSLPAGAAERQKLSGQLSQALAGSSTQYDLTIKAKEGHQITLKVKDVPATVQGQVVGVFSVARDMREQDQLERRLMYLAERDVLTGLYNRAKFDEELRKTLTFSRRYNTYGAVLFLDLDEFKGINDALGHAVGDHYLIQISDALQRRLRETDVLARLGGDEFAILLPHTTEAESVQVAQALLQTLGDLSITVGDEEVSAKASIGIALYPNHGESPKQLLNRADAALYSAKSHGGNNYVVYTDNKNASKTSTGLYAWRDRLLRAIEEDHLAIYLQPVTDVQQHAVHHYELLLQMQEDGDIIPASTFLYSSERHGLVDAIDGWIVDQAIDLVNEQTMMKNGKVSVKLSGNALVNPHTVTAIKTALANTKAQPSQLIVEIPETDVIVDIYNARTTIEKLRALGCQFTLGDFGMGFSTLHYLRHLPVDYIKIAGNLIRSLHHSPTDRELVQFIVNMARTLSIKTVAEHVNNEETLQLIQTYGVDFAQGHYVGRPTKLTTCSPAAALSSELCLRRRITQS